MNYKSGLCLAQIEKNDPRDKELKELNYSRPKQQPGYMELGLWARAQRAERIERKGKLHKDDLLSRCTPRVASHRHVGSRRARIHSRSSRPPRLVVS
jgi:hypothetical protein